MGWLLCKKHPDVKKFGNKVNMIDLEADPHIMFQQKYYLRLVMIISVVIPTLIPWFAVQRVETDAVRMGWQSFKAFVRKVEGRAGARRARR